MSDERYTRTIDKIMAMDLLVHSFNDEEWMESWLAYGVPDGCECREDYEILYNDDEELEAVFIDLSALFCRLIARQVVSVEMPSNPEEYKIAFNGGNIIV